MADNVVIPYNNSFPALRAVAITFDRVYGPKTAPGLGPTYSLLKGIYFSTAGIANVKDAHGDATAYTVVAGLVLPLQSQGITSATTTIIEGTAIGLFD